MRIRELVMNSRMSVVLALFAVIYLTFNTGVPYIMAWDVFGQHIYLPMLFDQHEIIYTDLSYFEHIQQQYQNTPTLYQLVLLDNGNFITKYTGGWAVLMLPFYGIAQIWAVLGDYPADGFSWPYQVMIAVGAVTYTAIGLLLVRKVLLHFFTDRMTAFLILVVVFGTNFLFMQYASAGSSHNLEFTLVAAMLLLTIRFHESPRIITGIALGSVIGLIGLVRPPDLILALIPVFWNVWEYKNIWRKAAYWFKNLRVPLFFTFISAVAVFSLQLIYWKLTSGSWLMNSYSKNAGEGFDWLNPHLTDVLFSFRKGWFIYTPVMLFAVYGFVAWYRISRRQAIVLIIPFFLFLYVVSCWSTWWYAASFSQRALIDAYPLLLIAMGMGFVHIAALRWRKWVFGSVGVLILFNLFQTLQINNGVLNESRMTPAYYYSVFGQLAHPTPEQFELLLPDRESLAATNKIGPDYQQTYNQRVHFGKGFELNDSVIYTPLISIPPGELDPEDPDGYAWLRIVWQYSGDDAALAGKIFTCAAMHKGQSYAWTGKTIADTLLIVDTVKNTVDMRYYLPHIRSERDEIRLGVWKESGPAITINSVLLEGYGWQQH